MWPFLSIPIVRFNYLPLLFEGGLRREFPDIASEIIRPCGIVPIIWPAKGTVLVKVIVCWKTDHMDTGKAELTLMVHELE